MRHVLEWEWELPEYPGPHAIDAYPDVYNWILVKHIDPEVIKFDDIAVKSLNPVNPTRYMNANTQYPGILVKYIHNPHNKPYRMIDGRYRLEKQKRNGNTEGLFYVLTYDQIKPFIFKLKAPIEKR